MEDSEEYAVHVSSGGFMHIQGDSYQSLVSFGTVLLPNWVSW